jgi:phosphoribosylanthranilate isomerase
MSDDADPGEYANRYPHAQGLLLDAYEINRPGGTGTVFPWERARGCETKSVIIAGGLNADNVSTAIQRSGAFAVDVASGVEKRPGIKDHDKIRALCCAVADHDRCSSHGSAG